MLDHSSRLHSSTSALRHSFLLPLALLLVLTTLLVQAPLSTPRTVRAAGVAGYALSFGDTTGSSAYAEVVSKGLFPLNNASRTLGFWAKSFDAKGQDLSIGHNSDHMVNYGQATDNNAFGAMLYIGDTWWFYAHNKDLYDINTNKPADKDWHFHEVTYDGSTITYYLDGNAIGTSMRTLDTKDGDLFFGIRPDKDLNNTFNGVIDEVRIWNRSLSQAEVKSDMTKKLTGTEQGLVGYWDFDEGTGQFIHDKSPNHLDGQRGSSPDVDFNDPDWIVSDIPTPLSGAYHVIGTVKDKQGKPIFGVAVTLKPLGRISYSDTTGYFSFLQLDAGSYTISAALNQYQFNDIPITLPPSLDNLIMTGQKVNKQTITADEASFQQQLKEELSSINVSKKAESLSGYSQNETLKTGLSFTLGTYATDSLCYRAVGNSGANDKEIALICGSTKAVNSSSLEQGFWTVIREFLKLITIPFEGYSTLGKVFIAAARVLIGQLGSEDRPGDFLKSIAKETLPYIAPDEIGEYLQAPVVGSISTRTIVDKTIEALNKYPQVTVVSDSPVYEEGTGSLIKPTVRAFYNPYSKYVVAVLSSDRTTDRVLIVRYKSDKDGRSNSLADVEVQRCVIGSDCEMIPFN